MTSLFVPTPLKPSALFPPASRSLRFKSPPPRHFRPLSPTSSPLSFSVHPFLRASSASLLPHAAMGVTDRLLQERIIFLGSSISQRVADKITSELLLLDARDPTQDIRLFINFIGGSHNATLAIYDVIQLVRADVSTIALGFAARSASIILGAGAKGKRLAMPNARIMIAQPLGEAEGTAPFVDVWAREVLHNKENITRIISGITGRTVEQVDKDIENDRFMSPIEAVEYGIIDDVIDRDAIIPFVPLPESREPNPQEKVERRRDFMKRLKKTVVPDDDIY